MMWRTLGVGALCAAIGAPSHGAVFFTFDDPGAGPEITHFAGDKNNAGVITYSGSLVNLLIDGTEEGVGLVAKPAFITMNILIGQVESQFGSILTAPIIGGSFHFFDATEGAPSEASLLLRGDFVFDAFNGGLVTLNTTGALFATSTGAALTLTEGAALKPMLGALTLAPTFDVSFTLTNIRGFDGAPGVFMTEDGYISSFFANSAFTGNAGTMLIPAPSALVLAGFAGMLGARRRR